jgi:macrolide transport system ATP-binding/permease protein
MLKEAAMPPYLALNDISKTFDHTTILSRVSLVLNAGDRLGLVGANGVGKSTLLKIITGELEADAGAIFLTPGTRLGYLAQAITGYEGKTIDQLIDDSRRLLRDLEAKMRALEEAMLTGSSEAVMAEYGEALDQYERCGGYEGDYRVEVVLEGLRVGHLPRSRDFSTLSGGEKARVGLAILLLEAHDVLLLDEPTNHLDKASLTWLEGFIGSYPGAALIVSHDRHFLNRTVTAIVEIDEHTRAAQRYAGNYDAYQRAKAIERRQWEANYERQQDEIKRLRLAIKETARRNDNYRTHTDGDKLILNAKIANHEETVSQRVRQAAERLSRILADPIPHPPQPLHFDADFDPAALGGRFPILAEGLTRRYGSRMILDGVDLQISAESRIVLVGPNGAGKSTLLRLLARVETPDAGQVYINPAVRIGILDQEQRDLDPRQSVLEAFRAGSDLPGQVLKAKMMQFGLFHYEELDRRVGQLSRGQQRKVQIARLIASQANVLILDEPTNHISFDVLEAFETALRAFPGPIVAASHDRRFIENFGGEVWEVSDGYLRRV